jgi:hypothetical protein
MTAINGSCQCGGVRFTVSSAPLMLENCHCSMCRKLHGSAYATFAMFEKADFRFTGGADMVESYRSSPPMQRSFCRKCGSRLTVDWEKVPDKLWVAAGAFDDELGLKPQFHIFVGSKAAWHDIGDDLPQHEAYPPVGD